MFKLFNLFNWVTDLVESFTFYGGDSKGGSSSSSSKDFFGVGKRAPYEALLANLLLGGPIGDTAGYYQDAKGKQLKGFKKGATYVPGQEGVSLTDFIQNQPGYQFQYGQGLEALNRNFAARGEGQTGAQDVALQNYGNQFAGNYLQQLIGNLQPAAGVGVIGQQSQSQGPSGLGGVFGTLAGIGMSMINPAAGAGMFTGSTGAVGGAIHTGSDRKLKTNIKHINTINGIKIYSFNYIWSYLKSIGVMAQDILEMPEYKHAVGMNSMGYTVDYSKLPI
jgi:hypothetical protein